MNQDNFQIKLDEDLTSQMTINKNLAQDIIVTNADKITILLDRHHSAVKRKNEWLTPVGIFISAFMTLMTARFESKFGVSAVFWESLFMIVCLASFFYSLWTVFNAIRFRNTGTIEEFISKLKNQNTNSVANDNAINAKKIKFQNQQIPSVSFEKPVYNKKIILKGTNNLYVSSEVGSKPMMCNRNSPGAWENFLVSNAGDGKVALSNNGKYISSEDGLKPIMCNRDKIENTEKFEWIPLPNNNVAFKGSNHCYISREDGKLPMTCTNPSIGSSTQFTLSLAEH